MTTPHRLADLDRGKADAGRVVHGLEHVLDQLPGRSVDLGDRLGNLPQPLVRQNENVPQRHIPHANVPHLLAAI